MKKLKEPPHNIQVEQEILGSIILENKFMNDIIDTVKVSDFYIDVNKEVFKAMSYLQHHNKFIDYTNLSDRLTSKNKGGEDFVDYILRLTDCVVSTANFDYKVEQLLDLSQKRSIYEFGEYIVNEDIKGIDIQNIKAIMNEKLDSINVVDNIETTNISEYGDTWLKNFKDPSPVQSILTGFKKLDEIVLIEPTNFVIVASRPGCGKSAYALNIVKNFSSQGKKGLFVSLEMSEKEIFDRLTANISRIPHYDIKRKKVHGKENITKIENAVKRSKDMDIEIYDRGGMTVEHLYNKCKILKKKGKLDFVVVDYLQLMGAGTKTQSRHQEVGYISRKLKKIAMDLEVPVIALAQLSRAGKDQSGKFREPQLPDLKESGDLEQDANTIIMLHTEATGDGDGHLYEKYIDMFIRKNRSGSLGKIHLSYYGDYMAFEEKEWDDTKKQFFPVQQLDLEKINDEKLVSDSDLPF